VEGGGTSEERRGDRADGTGIEMASSLIKDQDKTTAQLLEALEAFIKAEHQQAEAVLAEERD